MVTPKALDAIDGKCPKKCGGQFSFKPGKRMPDEPEAHVVGKIQDVVRPGWLKHDNLVTVASSSTLRFSSAEGSATEFPSMMSARLATKLQFLAQAVAKDSRLRKFAYVHVIKAYASRAVQCHPHGGQSDFVWLPARTPHVGPQYVW